LEDFMRGTQKRGFMDRLWKKREKDWGSARKGGARRDAEPKGRRKETMRWRGPG